MENKTPFSDTAVTKLKTGEWSVVCGGESAICDTEKEAQDTLKGFETAKYLAAMNEKPFSEMKAVCVPKGAPIPLDDETKELLAFSTKGL